MTRLWWWAKFTIVITLRLRHKCIDAFQFQPCSTSRSIHKTKLFGIKGFRSWFESAFPSAVTTIYPERLISSAGSTSKTRNAGLGSKHQPETFDHVLIDANQILHTTLRKAYNRKTKSSSTEQQNLDREIIEFALLLFLKEINRITSTTAIPGKSLVIAIDGSPGAAKLESQRRRRYSIYKKAESQERQIEILRERGWRDNDFGFSCNEKNNPLFAKHDRERVTLNITPGTAFMDKVTSALLYWAWQHVSRFPRVKVYLSPSSVHGEGEVKLLDWIMHGNQSLSSPKTYRKNVRQNETIAILGGDSDLVLMGLVIPPSITHNIHVILPGVKGESLVVSVWETTRIMARMIEGTAIYGSQSTKKAKRRRSLTLDQVNQARIDTALLVILNGNDYLPKLRGCRSGFNSFFPVYLDLVKLWMDSRSENDNRDSFLITLDDDGQLYMNVPFATEFFRALASNVDVTAYNDVVRDSFSTLQSHMGHLNNLVEARILPGPINFDVISPEDSFFHQELYEMNSKLHQNTTQLINEVFADGAEIMRLTMGNFPGDYMTSSNTTAKKANKKKAMHLGKVNGYGVISRIMKGGKGGRAYLFEIPHRQKSSLKAGRDRLACLALQEIFGLENMDVLFGGEDDESESDESDGFSGVKQQGFAPADAAYYLGGLLWNLETYQHGCCVNYGYDYGRRASVAPFELVEYLADIEKKGQLRIKCTDLIGHATTAPLSDGLSCLAAIPPQAWHIVPEPYSWLVHPSRQGYFEELYSTCFHPTTSAFDIESFSRKCNDELLKNGATSNAKAGNSSNSEVLLVQSNAKGRKVSTGNNFWTVLKYSRILLDEPFEPPEPFLERIPRLRRNARIRATKIPVKTQIRRADEISVDTTPTQEEILPEHDSSEESSDDGLEISVHDIPYKLAFMSSRS